MPTTGQRSRREIKSHYSSPQAPKRLLRMSSRFEEPGHLFSPSLTRLFLLRILYYAYEIQTRYHTSHLGDSLNSDHVSSIYLFMRGSLTW